MGGYYNEEKSKSSNEGKDFNRETNCKEYITNINLTECFSNN